VEAAEATEGHEICQGFFIFLTKSEAVPTASSIGLEHYRIISYSN
jgi:hypothetical protein